MHLVGFIIEIILWCTALWTSDSSWLFWDVVLCLCLSSTQHLSLFHVRAVKWDRRGNADAWITISHRWVWWGPSWSKCVQQYYHNKKPYRLRCDRTDVRIGLWRTFNVSWRRFRSEWHRRHCCQDKLSCCTGSPQVHRRSQWVMAEAQHINRYCPHWAFSCYSFLKLCDCLWKRQIDIVTSTWTHWMKDGPHCMTWQFRKCVCFFGIYCEDGA